LFCARDVPERMFCSDDEISEVLDISRSGR
jgi:hypothetical protein